jgi:hypothetical protein
MALPPERVVLHCVRPCSGRRGEQCVLVCKVLCMPYLSPGVGCEVGAQAWCIVASTVDATRPYEEPGHCRSAVRE